MNFSIKFYFNPAKLTFEKAAALQEAVARYQSVTEFNKSLSGHGTVHTHDPMYHEALRELEEANATLIDIYCGNSSFREYFGEDAKLNAQSATVFCKMCIEGRI